jgi:TPP-dependent trihydroxycyclohexane-1,2-dione (THcHDO) dehydratase
MRTEQITRTIYTFDELSDRAKDKARQKIADFNTDSEWWEAVYEDAANVGIKITGFDTGRAWDITGTIEDTEGTAHQIVKEHGEMCDTYKTAAAYLAERDTVLAQWPRDQDNEFDNPANLDDKLDELGEDFKKSILADYLKTLEKELEYLYSDEAIADTIEANGYEFDENGNLA